MDRDLSFLRQATNDDLEPLVGYILNAELSETLSINDKFKQHWPDHHQYVDLIEREIRDFGGNTFANAFRILFDRRPISYEEIVHDVADKLDVPYQEDSPISTIEDDILLAVMINAWPKMTEQEREELSSITDVKVDIPCHIPSSVPVIALQAAIRGWLCVLPNCGHHRQRRSYDPLRSRPTHCHQCRPHPQPCDLRRSNRLGDYRHLDRN